MSSKQKQFDALKLSWGKKKIEEFNFYQIFKYHKKREKVNTNQILSDQTISDIDFENLFAFADRTTSVVGQQYLYNKLLTFDFKQDFKEQEEVINTLMLNENLRLELQFILARLRNVHAYSICDLFLEPILAAPKNLYLIKIQSLASLLTFALIFVQFQFIFLLVPLIISNIFIHYNNKKNIQRYSYSMKQLSTMCIAATKIFRLPIAIEETQRAKESLKSISAINKVWSFFENQIQGSQELNELVWIVLEYLKICFLIEPILFFDTLNKLGKKRNDVKNVFEFIGKIDSYISVASLRESLPYYSFPKFVQSTERKIIFENMYHPLIEDCIPNSICIGDKSVLLTGSNMSGKTAFIRTIAINVIFSQTINTSFAKDSVCPKMKVFSVININDNLMEGKSYFFEEVLAIKNIIEVSKTSFNNLFLLDEIYKGTNTTERIAAARAVLSYISTNNIVCASTHDTELTTLLNSSFDLYHFAEVIQNKVIHFDFQLKKGPLKYGNAIRILEINDYPAEIVKTARDTAYPHDQAT